MQVGSPVAVAAARPAAVAPVTSSLETSIYHRYGPKKKRKKKRSEPRKIG